MPAPTILICDAEPSLRELMRVSLNADYTFAEASDTVEAIELANRIRPDLVLLDVMMPGGSGLAVVEQIRSHPDLSETPVVVVSAFADDSDRPAAPQDGPSGFPSNPY